MVDVAESIEYTPLSEYLFAVRRRLWLIVSVAVIFTAIASYLIFQIAPHYTATAIIAADGRHSDRSDLVFAKSDSTDPPALRTELEVVNSEAEVLRSPTIAQTVVDRLQLQANPDFTKLFEGGGFTAMVEAHIPQGIAKFLGMADTGPPDTPARREAAATNELMKILSVGYDGKSYILQLRATTENPQLSAVIANAVAQAYLDQQQQANLKTLQQAEAWFRDNLAQLQAKVVQSDAAVEQFRIGHNLTEIKGMTVGGQQLSELNAQLALASADRVQKETQLGAWSEATAHPEDLQTYSGVLASRVIQQLRDRQADLMREQADLKSQYGNRYPATIRINAEIANVNQSIKAEVTRITQSAAAEVQAARAKEDMLRQKVAQIQNASAVDNEAQVQLRSLQREADANRALYRDLLQRSKQTSAELSTQASTSRVISGAMPPLTASYPKKGVMIAGSGLTGLMLGLFLTFMLEYGRDGFRCAKDLDKATGLKTLGLVPMTRKSGVPQDEILERTNSLYSESIHAIAALLGVADLRGRSRIVLVTSSLPGEGKTSFALSLARAAASGGHRALFIDCDFRRSRLAQTLGRGEAQEIDPWDLSDGISIAPKIIRDRSGIDIIATFSVETDPHRILASPSFRQFLWRAYQNYHLVVIDAPPVLAVADALQLAALSDQVLFVVRWDTTPRKVLQNALAALRKLPCNLVGAVLTQVDMKKQSKYRYGDIGQYAESCGDYYRVGELEMERRSG